MHRIPFPTLTLYLYYHVRVRKIPPYVSLSVVSFPIENNQNKSIPQPYLLSYRTLFSYENTGLLPSIYRYLGKSGVKEGGFMRTLVILSWMTFEAKIVVEGKSGLQVAS